MVPIVGVMGSGRERHDTLASAVAEVIARTGACLLVGGGGGVMSSVAEYFKRFSPAGTVIGVLPCRAPGSSEPPSGYPNPWIDIAIQTHLHLSGTQGTDPMSRNHINVLSSTAVVALPGGAGTVSEVCLAHAYGRPVVVFHGGRGELVGAPETVEQTASIEDVTGFLRRHVN